MTTVAERVAAVVAPVVDDLGLELYDIEHEGPAVRVVVDRPGGVDIDVIAQATRRISRALDEADPIAEHYTLEVSSPGLERALRTPAHFTAAADRDETVAIKTKPGVEGDRRLEGRLTGVDEAGITVRLADGAERGILYDQIERARTVFAWGPTPRPGKKEHSR